MTGNADRTPLHRTGEQPSEQAFLDSYDFRDHPPFAVTVDVVVFTVRDGALHVAVIERNEPPFIGRWALPGGFVRPDEDLAEAARRELAEETKIRLVPDHLEQLRAYGRPDRDPRRGRPEHPGRIVTVAFWAIMAEPPEIRGGGDAADARFVPVADILRGDLKLAFDHREIIEDAHQRASDRLEYTTDAARYCPPEFTISQLRQVYEAVWETELDHGNFQRKVRSEGFLVALDKQVPSGESGGRPAALFSSPETRLLQQPLTSGRPTSKRQPERSDADGYPAWLSGERSRPWVAAADPDPIGDPEGETD